MAEEEERIGWGHATDLLLLTWAAGALDALSYLRVQVFAANMTGNVVLLGLDLIKNEHHRGLWYGTSILAFATGAAIAVGVIIRWLGARSWNSDVKAGLALEFPFVTAAAALCVYAPLLPAPWATASLVASGACGLGIQSVAVRRLKLSGVVTTFITGTITTAVLEGFSGGSGRAGNRSSPALLVAMLAAYVAAAAASAALSPREVIVAALMPPLAVAVVWIRSLVAERA